MSEPVDDVLIVGAGAGERRRGRLAARLGQLEGYLHRTVRLGQLRRHAEPAH